MGKISDVFEKNYQEYCMQMTKSKDGSGYGDPVPSYGIALSTAEVSTVPIPAAAWLFASGLFGLVGIRRRFKK